MMPGSNTAILRTTGAIARSELIRVASGPEWQATFIALGLKALNQLHIRQDHIAKTETTLLMPACRRKCWSGQWFYNA